jgi:hypothetical protein
MLAKPRSITTVGLVQTFLAGSFVLWLLFFPSTAGNFAWPIIGRQTAMFIGAAFIARTYMGIHLWRQKQWYRLRWQMWGNYGFLAVIMLATFWHVESMNWTSNIIIAHIWVLAYVVEPLMLFLIEPRGERANQPLPAELRQGPILMGLKWVCAAGFIIGIAIAGLLLINPAFMSTRWPWPLDAFDARVMAAFPTLVALWAVHVYFAHDWAEVRSGVLGLALFAAAEFVVWLVNLPTYDFSRNNVWTVGIVFGLFAVLLTFYYWRHERAAEPAPSALAPIVGGDSQAAG